VPRQFLAVGGSTRLQGLHDLHDDPVPFIEERLGGRSPDAIGGPGDENP
jgi:hypothetical protein